jgi:hypothetical protein
MVNDSNYKPFNKGAVMAGKQSRAIKSFLFCFICNGILIAVFLMGVARPVIVGVGVVLTFILWLLVVYLVDEPVRQVAGEALLLPVPEPRQSSEGAVQMLAALQREGRLIDFLQEDLSAYEDGQIGAAVRSIHMGCREILKEHMEIKPVFEEKEGSTVTIPAGFDTTAIRLTGNVTGNPPFRGTLRHRGWKVERIRLPHSQEQKDHWILAPAEVEIE